MRLWNKGVDGGNNETTLRVLRQALNGVWAENSRGYRIRDGLFLEWGDRFQWPDRNAPEGDDRVYCHGLGDHFGILSDGTVVPCCLDAEGTLALGNLFLYELEDVLTSPRAKTIYEGFTHRRAAESLCRKCGYARRFSN
jgi:radical SAM protein with 4Fe4S-binding SPASM domain